MIRYHLLFSPLLLFLLAFNACSFSMSSANNNADGDVDIDQVGFEEEVDGEEDKADNVDVVEEELELEPPNSPACKDWMTDERYLNEEGLCCNEALCCEEICSAGKCQWEYEYDLLDFSYHIPQPDYWLNFRVGLSASGEYKLYYDVQYYTDRASYPKAIIDITGTIDPNVAQNVVEELLPDLSQVNGCSPNGYSGCVDTSNGHLAINREDGIVKVDWGNCFTFIGLIERSTAKPLWETFFLPAHQKCMDFEPPEDESTLFEVYLIRDSDGDSFTLTVTETDLAYTYRHTQGENANAVLELTGVVSTESIEQLFSNVEFPLENPICVVEQGECIIPGKGYVAQKHPFIHDYRWLSFDCPVTSLLPYSFYSKDISTQWQAIRTLLQELVGDDDPDLP